MEPEPVAARRISMTDARIAVPTWQRSYLAPSYQSVKPTSAAEALDVLAQILGGNANSRLYQSLVIDRKIATEAGGWYSGNLKDYGTFGLYGVPSPGISMEALEQAMDGLIADVIAKGVTQDELTRAKNSLIASATYALDSPASLARLIGGTLAIGGSIEDVTAWPDKIAKITAQDVQEAARQVLDMRNSVTSLLLPANGAAGQASAPAISRPALEQN